MLKNGVEILLVEDNSDDAKLAIHAFEKQHLANKVCWVQDGVEALEFLFCTDRYADRNIGNGPKLVLLDLNLPLLDGQAFVGLIPQTALLGASPPALTALVEPPATISPTTPLSDLLTRFAQGRDTCLAVTTRDRLVGLITRSDLLTAVMHGSPNRKDRP